MHCVLSIRRRVRACTRLSEAAKALATRDYVRGISGLSTLPNTFSPSKSSKSLFRLLRTPKVASRAPRSSRAVLRASKCL
jgi:hypothetical protein